MQMKRLLALIIPLRLKAIGFKAIETLCNTRGNTGGLIKRIDENRELLEVLQRDAPAFLADHPCVVGWIASNDAFFVQLNDVIRSRRPGVNRAYPRPWPELSTGSDATSVVD